MKLPCVNPLHRCKCCEPKWMTLDGTSIAPFLESDIKKIWFSYESNPRDWDGDVACILELFDGRYVSWEASWGPTGNGFNCDAYGGGESVLFSANLGNAVSLGLSPANREKYNEQGTTTQIS